MKLPESSNVEVLWTALGIPQYPQTFRERMYDEIIVQAMHFRPFKGHYLFVTTPGWQIVEARVGNIIFLGSVDGAVYSVAEHDRFERMGQLERHKVSMPVAQVGNMLTFRVKPHYPKLKGEREFTAVIAGEELQKGYW